VALRITLYLSRRRLLGGDGRLFVLPGHDIPLLRLSLSDAVAFYKHLAVKQSGAMVFILKVVNKLIVKDDTQKLIEYSVCVMIWI